MSSKGLHGLPHLSDPREQYLGQVRAQDSVQIDECDLFPMILLVAGKPFSHLPFLCPPNPLLVKRTEKRAILHGMLTTQGVSEMGRLWVLWTCRGIGYSSSI